MRDVAGRACSDLPPRGGVELDHSQEAICKSHFGAALGTNGVTCALSMIPKLPWGL
jgi:hypothetical protein